MGALSGTKPGTACGVRRKPLGGAAQFSAGVLAIGPAYRCKRVCGGSDLSGAGRCHRTAVGRPCGWNTAGPRLRRGLRGSTMGEARGPFRNALHPDRKLEPVSSGFSASVCRGPDPGRRERGRRFGRRFSSDAAVCSGAGAHGAGAAAAPMLSGLEHGLLHLCGNRAGELLQGGWPCAGKAAGVGGQTSGCSFGSGAHLNAAAGPCGPSHRAASGRDGADHRGDAARCLGDGAVVPSAFEKRAGDGCAVDHCSRIRAGLSGNAYPAGPAFRVWASMRNDGQ